MERNILWEVQFNGDHTKEGADRHLKKQRQGSPIHFLKGTQFDNEVRL
jgi:hypothetical protein